MHKRARERTVRFAQKRKNIGEKSTWLSFARRRGSAEKGTEIPSFFLLVRLPSFSHERQPAALYERRR